MQKGADFLMMDSWYVSVNVDILYKVLASLAGTCLRCLRLIEAVFVEFVRSFHQDEFKLWRIPKTLIMSHNSNVVGGNNGYMILIMVHFPCKDT